jgi:hypothetical protein
MTGAFAFLLAYHRLKSEVQLSPALPWKLGALLLPPLLEVGILLAALVEERPFRACPEQSSASKAGFWVAQRFSAAITTLLALKMSLTPGFLR